MQETRQISRHERRRQQTRAKLVETALRLMLDKGYDAITIQEITDTADLGRGTFYIHFKDKEDLVWSVVKEGLDAADRQAHWNIRGGLPEKPVYFAYLNIFTHAEQNRDLYRLMLGSQGSAMLTARVQNYLAEDFERELRDFRLIEEADVPYQIRAQIVTGAVIRMVIWWLETPNNFSAEQMAAMLYMTLQQDQPPG